MKPALMMQGIECRGDGSGRIEFDIMDQDFRGHVRFKDFCKFVKHHEMGIAYGEKDSSISSSEVIDEMVREQWRVIDPERTCHVPIRTVARSMHQIFHGGESD